MGGTILTETDRIVSHDEKTSSLRDSSHTHSVTHVIGEDEEGSAVGDESRSVQGDSVGDGTHSVLTDSITDVALSRGILLEITKLLHQGHVGGGKIGRSTDETGDDASKSVQHGLRVETGGQALVGRGEAGESLLPSGREVARGDALVVSPLLGVLVLVLGGNLVPGSVGIRSALSERVGKLSIGLLGDLELTIRPFKVLTGSSGLSGTERGTVDIVGVSLVRGSVSDQGRDLDKRRLVGDRLGLSDGVLHAVKVVVSILDVLHVPAHSFVTSADILSERDLSVSINGDTVVIV
jgi:hypothetical protein